MMKGKLIKLSESSVNRACYVTTTIPEMCSVETKISEEGNNWSLSKTNIELIVYANSFLFGNDIFIRFKIITNALPCIHMYCFYLRPSEKWFFTMI